MPARSISSSQPDYPAWAHPVSPPEEYHRQSEVKASRIWKVEDVLGLSHLVRIDLDWDHYPFQSSAKVYIWYGPSGWVLAHSLLDAACRSSSRSEYRFSFYYDTKALLLAARLILSGGVPEAEVRDAG